MVQGQGGDHGGAQAAMLKADVFPGIRR